MVLTECSSIDTRAALVLPKEMIAKRKAGNLMRERACVRGSCQVAEGHSVHNAIEFCWNLEFAKGYWAIILAEGARFARRFNLQRLVPFIFIRGRIFRRGVLNSHGNCSVRSNEFWIPTDH